MYLFTGHHLQKKAIFMATNANAYRPYQVILEYVILDNLNTKARQYENIS